MLVNATTASSVLDDLKVEEQADWFEPDLQLVVRTGALAKAGSSPHDLVASYQVIFVSGRVTVSF